LPGRPDRLCGLGHTTPTADGRARCAPPVPGGCYTPGEIGPGATAQATVSGLHLQRRVHGDVDPIAETRGGRQRNLPPRIVLAS
ncbi:hypothetical protein LPJ61_005595, partial [Coemansia biformis]